MSVRHWLLQRTGIIGILLSSYRSDVMAWNIRKVFSDFFSDEEEAGPSKKRWSLSSVGNSSRGWRSERVDRNCILNASRPLFNRVHVWQRSERTAESLGKVCYLIRSGTWSERVSNDAIELAFQSKVSLVWEIQSLSSLAVQNRMPVSISVFSHPIIKTQFLRHTSKTAEPTHTIIPMTFQFEIISLRIRYSG